MSEFKNLVADITLSYYPKIKIKDRPKVNGARAVAQIFRDNWDDTQIGLVEEFKVMLLDRGTRIIGILPLSKGGMSGVYVDSKLIFIAALKAAASNIILVHNHPSTDARPSAQDIRLTRKICEGARLLDMEVLDHIILTADDHYSFSEEGLIP